MPEFLLECYVSRTDGGAVARGEERARLAAAELTLAGTRVRFDRSINVPEDEICFFVFDAPSARVVALAAQRAGFHPFRVVEAVSSRNEKES